MHFFYKLSKSCKMVLKIFAVRHIQNLQAIYFIYFLKVKKEELKH